MLDELFAEVAGKIISRKSSKAYFSDKSYKALAFDTSNFHDINRNSTGRENKIKKICFIDGGNIEIVGNNNFSLSLARIYSTVWKSGKRISASRKEFCIFIESSNFQYSKEMQYLARIFIDGKETEKISFTLMKSDEMQKPESIVSNVRRILEIRRLIQNCNELSEGDVIILDGSLQEKEEYEKTALNEAYETTRKKGILLAGVCKTSSILTDAGDNLVGSINIIAMENGHDNIWYYDNICENNNPRHKAELVVAKLHSKAEFSFLIEISEFSKDKTSEIISELSENSMDPIFLGYPYGLIEADINARCSKEEQGFLLSKFMHNCKDQKKVQSILNTNKAHGILDKIR